MTLTGRCQCGAVRYRHVGRVGPLYICHCRECQKQSASAFGMSLVVDAVGLASTGEVRLWQRATDSGRRLACAFCPGCGTRLWHRSEGGATLTLKAGTLDEPVDAAAAIHIWTSRRLPGIAIPAGARCFAEEPDEP